MRLTKLFTISILLFNSLAASPFLERYDYSALLEPEGRCMSGAGQSTDAFLNYWNQMPSDSKPIIYMYYMGLNGLQPNWWHGLQSTIMDYHGDNFVMLQIGLSMTSDGNPSAHYEQDVASGVYDDEIQYLLTGLDELSIPAYLRIGYEFNGTNWNGYQPNTYIQAYRRIYNAITARNLEIATLWCYAVDGDNNYMSWYPGDDVVDWWSIDVFSTSHLTDQRTYNFLNDAHAHGKPVAIGESTPRYVGVTDGLSDWNTWFVPYFDLVHNNPGIKMLSYINWNWGNYSQWSDWGDARLEANSIVRNNFIAEMDSTIYLHGIDESDFRGLLGYNDNTPPSAPQNFTYDGSILPIDLYWDSVQDISGIAHYIIRAGGEVIGYSNTPNYNLDNLASGATHSISVQAMDMAGNRSPQAGLQIILEDVVQRVSNGNFNAGMENWTFSVFNQNAGAVFDIDNSDSNPSARVSINQSTNTNWHIQLLQDMHITADRYYTISYKAWADEPTSMETWIQMAHDPYSDYAFQEVQLSTDEQTFHDTTHVGIDDEAWLTFMVGNSGTSTIWFDDIEVREYTPEAWETVDIETKPHIPQVLHLSPAWPNPFNPTTNISFELPETGFTDLTVVDISGREVAQLLNTDLPAGLYHFSWTANHLHSGVYFIRLNYDGRQSIQRCLLLK